MKTFVYSSHSVHLLYHHLVLVTKYRRKVLEVFLSVSDKNGVELIEMNHGEDHVHILFRSKPNLSLWKFVGQLKSLSSSMSGNKLWSRSYCLLTTGGVPIETVRKYIEGQRR